jgi:transcriptional regulator with PAS, ATPase and Fis domain
MTEAQVGTIEIVRERDRTHAVVAPLELRVLTGPMAKKVFRAQRERFVIGVHPSADFVLDDETVSRFQCEISLEGDRIAIRDLGSKNGTLVDGVSVLNAYLRVGSRIKIGQTELELGLGNRPVEVSLTEDDRFGELVGQSLSMRAQFALLARAADSDATVLLGGESGTGKEAAAQAIHDKSARRDGPFLIVDCGAIPAELLESELFGHEKGSFTGAVSDRQGAFEAAEGGSIFLDEIGELGLDLQPKLLRALEQHQVKRVGSNSYRPVDVRVIAATNRDLRAEVNTKRFRADLYYRLAVIEIRLPPLRERPDDIPVLVESILHGLNKADAPEANALRTQALRDDMASRAWPGNVRELRNFVERFLALGGAVVEPTSAEVLPEDPANLDVSSQDLKTARERWVRCFERRYLERLLAAHGDNASAAARSAGVDRKYLYRLLWRHGLR